MNKTISIIICLYACLSPLLAADDFMDIPLMSKVHKAYLCIIEISHNRKEGRLALIDEGDHLNFPNIDIKGTSLKGAIQESVFKNYGLKIQQSEIHPFIHIEAIEKDIKRIEDYYIIPISPEIPSRNLLYEKIGKSSVFYPGTYQIFSPKPLADFERLKKIQLYLDDGFKGKASTPEHYERFQEILATYGPKVHGTLTLSPQIFCFYGRRLFRRESAERCILS